MILEAFPVEVGIAFHKSIGTMVVRNPNRSADVGPEIIFLVRQFLNNAVS